ncbi:hypothetical protein ES703_64824 [subsurface metagenome]
MNFGQPLARGGEKLAGVKLKGGCKDAGVILGQKRLQTQ